MTDAYWGNNVLNCRFEGANGSTSITDDIGVTMTAHGAAAISTSSPKYGSACGSIPDSSSYISAAFSDTLTGDFTVEFWYKSSASNAYAALFSQNYFAAGGIILTLNGGYGDGAPEIYWNDFGNFNFFKSDTGGFNDGAWHHYAFVRSGTTCKLYIDGVVRATRASVSTVFTLASFNIGTDTVFGGRTCIGECDDFRITKGIARYTANFTPPGEIDSGATNTNYIFYPPVADLTLTANAPAFIAPTHYVFNAPVASLTLTGNSPAYDITPNHYVFNAPTANLMLTAYAPSFSISPTHYIFNAPTANLTLTANAPGFINSGVHQNYIFHPPVANLTLTANAPEFIFLKEFITTPPTTEPVSVTFSGFGGVSPTGAAAENLYQSSSGYQTVVIDINAPETPTHNTY